jgi:type IX secretion system PorP/SprF family membrane protein
MNYPLNKPFTCTVILVLLLINIGKAQNQVFSQFMVNPYQFNPSFAASNGYLEANVFFRKQWLGIENAPEALAFNAQAPVGRNVSLGLNVVSNKTILLKYTGAAATFAYKVRFSYHHHLNFGKRTFTIRPP